MTEPTPLELAEWGVAVNNALMGDETAGVTEDEAYRAIESGHEAFRQLIIEIYKLQTITPDDWFGDTVVRRHWAEQIMAAHRRWKKAKKNDL